MPDEMKVDRFDIGTIHIKEGRFRGIVPQHDGAYVRYADYASLQQQLSAAREANARLCALIIDSPRGFVEQVWTRKVSHEVTIDVVGADLDMTGKTYRLVDEAAIAAIREGPSVTILDELRELVARETNEDFGVSNVVHATDCRAWVVHNGTAVVAAINSANALLRYTVCADSDDSYSLDVDVLREAIATLQRDRQP